MNTLTVNHLTYNQPAKQSRFAPLRFFSYEFKFGRSYLITEAAEGSTLSWIIGGGLDPRTGQILLDGKSFDRFSRQRAAWLVRCAEIKRFGVFNQSVQAQIQHGLNTYPTLSHQDIIERFYLTPDRYRRKLSQLSNEAWRASCAIGFTNGRRIFCFPSVENSFLKEYGQLWLERLLAFLKSIGALILIPTQTATGITNLCDEIVSVSATS